MQYEKKNKIYTAYTQHLNTLRNSNKFRSLNIIPPQKNLEYLDFSSNDYLNLNSNNDIISAAKNAAEIYGIGSTGSRLLSGNKNIHQEFEAMIAKDKHSESSLIFNSGFQANISTLSCLLDQKVLNSQPLVFFDKLNHSSLYQGVFLTKAYLCRYKHNDINHLEYILEKYKNDSRPKFIVTETVFGMDGDIAPLEDIVKLSEKFNTFLYLDEAHATGVFGVNGYGLSTTIKLQHIPHIIMGTFSKAIGVSGGYIASHKIIRDFIINKATGFIYSTAPSPLVIGATFKSWQMIRFLEQERKTLQYLGNYLRQHLMHNGFNIGTSQTHIVPIILNKEEKCLQIQKVLFEHRIIVSCIRSPTVPPGTARLRIAITTKHSLEDLQLLIKTLKNVM